MKGVDTVLLYEKYLLDDESGMFFDKVVRFGARVRMG